MTTRFGRPMYARVAIAEVQLQTPYGRLVAFRWARRQAIKQLERLAEPVILTGLTITKHKDVGAHVFEVEIRAYGVPR